MMTCVDVTMKKLSCRFHSTVNTDFIDSTGFMAEGEIVDATNYMNFEFYIGVVCYTFALC